jgi:glycosyltransferase involved in cell wall biosynthesis
MGDRPLRVLAVTHEAIRNGAPMVALQVLEWLHDERGYEIETLVLSDGPLRRDFARIGPTHVIALNDPGEMLVAWRDEPEPSVEKITEFADLERERIATLRPEAEHLTGFDVLYLNSATSARALRILPEVPPVVIAHIHELDGAYNHWFETADREALMRTDPDYVVVGNRVGQNLVETHGVDPERITLVRNEFARPAPPPEVEVTRLRARLGLTDEVVIGAMGAAEWRKGPDLFVQMAAIVRRRLPDAALQFYWVGRTDDYHLRQYETDAARLGLGDRLRFVGEQTDAASWLRVFDLFCLTSREDPFPLVCLEAGALGTPVISFDNGGMAELTAEAGGDEPLIEIIDYLDVEDMADAVVRRVQDRARREEDGRRLQAWLDEHLFVAGTVGRIADLIDARVAAHPRAGRTPA